MNNATYTATMQPEPIIDRMPYLISKEKELQETITSIKTVADSKEWKILKRNVFDGLKDSIQRMLANEKDEKEIYRLQGQLGWADKFGDFIKFSRVLEVELSNIRQQIKHAKA
jgi:hypothetical protein